MTVNISSEGNSKEASSASPIQLGDTAKGVPRVAMPYAATRPEITHDIACILTWSQRFAKPRATCTFVNAVKRASDLAMKSAEAP